ncbi:hypothetical protein F4778DRAFT_161469 [Xylariomycetidae sp. FL2044]|nr:hypothetical protein F4778DRAFT_161469 [Xylariomycetidae sp. FL2044]
MSTSPNSTAKAPRADLSVTNIDVRTPLESRQAQIACPTGHDPKSRTGSEDAPELDTVTNRSIVNSLYSLQQRRTAVVQRTVLKDCVQMIESSYPENMQEAVNVMVGADAGLFNPAMSTAEAVYQVSRVRDAAGKHLRYVVPFVHIRPQSHFCFWFLPIDGIWVLVFMEFDDPEGDGIAHPRPDGQKILAPRIAILDVVKARRTRRRRHVQERLLALLPEGDIEAAAANIVDIDVPELDRDAWQSGFVVFALFKELLRRINVSETTHKDDEGGDDDNSDDILFKPIDIAIHDIWIEVQRAEMEGLLAGRFHLVNRRYSLTAIELPGDGGDYDPLNMQLTLGAPGLKHAPVLTAQQQRDLAERGNAGAKADRRERKKKLRAKRAKKGVE